MRGYSNTACALRYRFNPQPLVCWSSKCDAAVQWVDVLALSGDSADNIPGVKGVGIKTAPNLVRAHGDTEGVLAAAPEEKKKVSVSLHCTE